MVKNKQFFLWLQVEGANIGHRTPGSHLFQPCANSEVLAVHFSAARFAISAACHLGTSWQGFVPSVMPSFTASWYSA